MNSYVEFNLVCHISEPSAKQTKVLEEAFNMSTHIADRYVTLARSARQSCKPYRVKVALEQFALFVIHREFAGLRKGFRELDVKLITNYKEPAIVDFTLYS